MLANCRYQLLAVVFVCLLAPASAPAAGQRPEPHEIRFGPLTMAFAYCPEGEFDPEWQPGKPQPNQGKPQPKQGIGPFWIGQSEVSQLQMQQVLKVDQAAWQERAQQLKKVKKDKLTLRTNFEDYIEGFSEDRTGNNLPIYNLTVLEAAEFCRSLARLAEKYSPEASLATHEFRLPTEAEWQYACRARETLDEQKELPHFNKKWGLELKKAKEFWEAHRKRAGAYDENEQQTIDDIFSQLRGMDEISKAADVAKELLRKYYGILYIGPSAQLQNVTEGTWGNGWKIQHMHGNVAEWVLPNTAMWEKLTNERINTDEIKQEEKLRTAGGSFNVSPRNLRRLFVWNTKQLEKILDPLYQEKVRSEQPGIRVHMQQKFSFEALRRVVLSSKDPASSRVAQDEIADQKTDLVREKVPNAAELEAFSFYLYDALLLYKASEWKKAEERIKNQVGTRDATGQPKVAVPGDRRYFQQLAKRIAEDH